MHLLCRTARERFSHARGQGAGSARSRRAKAASTARLNWAGCKAPSGAGI